MPLNLEKLLADSPMISETIGRAYVAYHRGEATICLDGDFDVEDLKEAIALIEKHRNDK